MDNTLKELAIGALKLILGITVLLALTVGAYYLGKHFIILCGGTPPGREGLYIPEWIAGLILELLIAVFLFLSYKIGERILEY
jgi:hypothetical protein